MNIAASVALNSPQMSTPLTKIKRHLPWAITFAIWSLVFIAGYLDAERRGQLRSPGGLRWIENRDSEGAAGAQAAAVTERQAKPVLFKQPARETVSWTVLLGATINHSFSSLCLYSPQDAL